MGKFNTYRYLVLRDAEGTSNGGKKFSRKAKRPAKMQRVFLISTIVAVVIFIGLYTSLLNPVVNRLADTLGYSKPVFAVIIDAGSTGSRVLAYTFHQSFVGGHLILDDELFHEVKPGLSSFVDNPQQGAQSILTLLQKAFTVVPEPYRATTPLLLRATAGLRLLEPVAAERLVDTVRAALVSSGFKVGADSVEIMDGQDEGIYSWFTVNFLQKRLDGQTTTTALDLGGGSTQITYEPPTVAALKPLVSVPGAHRNYSLYTYSYLNLGLMAVRRGVLLAQNPEVAKSVESNCINPIVREQSWKYANKEYLVSGSQKDIAYLNVAETQISVADKIPIVQMEVCKNIIYTLVKGLMANIPTPTHLQTQHINAFSYYFDRASEAGLIDPIAGGKVKVSDFMAASERECQSPNVDQPWACLDLTYISILLQETFKLDPSKELELRKKIDGHEISWALGLAYNTLVKDL